MEWKLEDIISAFPVKETVGRKDRMVNNVADLKTAIIKTSDIVWVSEKNINRLTEITDGCIICPTAADRKKFNSRCTYLLVDNPRWYFLRVIRAFFSPAEPRGIASNATIDPSVKMGPDVTINAGVVIERECVIGEGTYVDSNTVIKRGTVVGKNVRIGANNTIGGVGFGYEKNEDGLFELIPHVGNVVIEDHVEIGNNTAIDRAVLGSTIIRRNAKIDNLVHIAHGVEIGENSLIIANSMIAGSTVIGKGTWVAPSASVLNKITVGDNVTIGMGAVVLRDVAAGQTIVGNPGRDLSQMKKRSAD